MKRSDRRLCTRQSLIGAVSIPIVFSHLHEYFQFKFFDSGGWIAALADVGLYAIYFITAHTLLDLWTDYLDWSNGRYRDDADVNAGMRSVESSPSRGLISLRAWGRVEGVTANVAGLAFIFSGAGFARFFLDDSFVQKFGSAGSKISIGLAAIYGLSYVGVVWSYFSIFNRLKFGIVAVPFRWFTHQLT